jgi:ABC-type transport system involved in multi-copper enzyme maturation permease subunit
MAQHDDGASWIRQLFAWASPHIGMTWFRQNFSWSNSWISWRERFVLLAFLATAAGLVQISVASVESRGPQISVLAVLGVAWAFYLVAVVVSSWLGWLQLFGPVLFYDMVRTARRSRYVLMRLLYASLLFVILCVIFFTASRMGLRERVDRRETAILAETFFSAFMIVQLVLVVLLTPAYVAGAIAEEKDRKTLEFMLATDLNNREIVLSKLLSRVANMTLLLLTGLPILSILQFLGGVDSQLMLSGFAGTGLTMLGIASVGILFSTLFQRPRDAIGLTYLFIVAFFALGTLGKSLTLAAAPMINWPIFWIDGTPRWADLSNVINAGNPIAATIDIIQGIERATLITDLPVLLNNYAIFHGALALVCIVWSVIRLRAIALKQTAAGTNKKTPWWESHRPPIGELPMFWKELHIEGRMRMNWLAWGIVVVLVLLTVGSGLFMIGIFVWDVFLLGHGMHWWEFAEAMNWWFRIAGTGVACLMILMVAVRASTSIAAERERDTFDALITTPLSAEAILFAKLVGCLSSLRLAWLWFGCMVTVAILARGIHLLAAPIVIGTWFIYATFFTMIGMWFSMACKTSMRATVYTVLTTLLLGGGHWIVMAFLCYLPAALVTRGGTGHFFEYAIKFQAGMTPPIVLGLYAYSWQDLSSDLRHVDDWKHVAMFALFGLVLWAAGCLVMWYGMLLPKFKQITRREELLYE